MSPTLVWVAVLSASLGSYLTKLAGQSVPHGLLTRAWVQRVAGLLPIALLSALVVVQTFAGSGGHLVLDARAAGLAAGVSALLLRAPFIVVVVVAAATAAVLRAMGLAA